MTSSQPPAKKYEVLVIGAGPVGLTAATALAKDGHRVTVLERHPTLQSPGSALSIQPSASKCLIELGAKELLEKHSLSSENFTWWSYREDEPMAVSPYPAVSETTRYQSERPVVQKIMYNIAQDIGVQVVFNKAVVKLTEEGDRPSVWTQDGQEYTADLIVGADGIKSSTRRLIFPTKNVEAITNEERVFVTSVPASVLKSDPRVQPLLHPLAFQLTFGPGRFTVTRGIAHDSYAMMFIVMKYGPPGPVDGSWNVPGDIEELKRLFSDFNAPTRAYLEHVTAAEIWQMAYGCPLESWRSEGGRVVLIGDAAHAMLPYNAQGLTQGVEDAVALARMLRWAPERGIPGALACFEKLRRPRVERIIQSTLANGGRNTLPDGPAQQGRDATLRKMHGVVSTVNWARVIPDPEAPPRSPPYDKWEQGYDVIAEVDRFMADAGEQSKE